MTLPTGRQDPFQVGRARLLHVAAQLLPPPVGVEQVPVPIVQGTDGGEEFS
nr:hypothetical protein [Streptomyces antibioticus]